MIEHAILIIAIVTGPTTTINYEKVENMKMCERMALEVKDDGDDDVYVVCVPLEKITEV